MPSEKTGSTVKIVHVNDPHFGARSQIEVWETVSTRIRQLKPELVLVTGNAVDACDEASFSRAKEELEKLGCPVRLCPVNFAPATPKFLGGLWPGNGSGRSSRAAIRHYETFLQKLALNASNGDVSLGPDENRWHIRVLPADARQEGKFLEPGFLSPDALDALDKAIAKESEEERELVLVLQQEELFTAGAHTFPESNVALNRLSASHVNFLLLGHASVASVERCTTVEEQDPGLTVLRAGCAVGVVPDRRELSGRRFDQTRATFNYLELTPERSVYVRTSTYGKGGWSLGAAPKSPLLDSQGVRRSRYLRRSSEKASGKKIVRYVEFHANRNITITETYKNFGWNGVKTWSKVTENSTGYPIAEVSVDFDGGALDRAPVVTRSVQSETHPHRFRVEADLRRLAGGMVRSMTLRIDWQGGALLTARDFELLDRTTLGPHRSRGREFAAVDAWDEHLESASLLVRLPTKLAPKADSVEAWVEAPEHKNLKIDRNLTAAIRHFSPGVFSLDVPYPLPKYCYVLVWQPSAPARNRHSDTFEHVARIKEHAEKLLGEYIERLGSLLFSRASFSLFVPSSPAELSCRAHRWVGCDEKVRGTTEVPQTLSLKSPYALHRIAWWSGIQIALASNPQTLSKNERDSGFVQGECGLIVVPVRQYSAHGHEACALIRIGIHDPDISAWTKTKMNDAMDLLARPVFHLLERADLLSRNRGEEA